MEPNFLDIFKVDSFQFPYDYLFPEQAEDELILYATREHKIYLYLRLLFLLLVSTIIVVISFSFSNLFSSSTNGANSFITGISALFLFLGYWLIKLSWQKKILLITNKRVIKFSSLNPITKNLSCLELGDIKDSSSISKGYVHSFLKLANLNINSSDDNIVFKNILLTLQTEKYLAKVIDIYKHDKDLLLSFKPFTENLDVYEIDKINKQYPGYWN